MDCTKTDFCGCYTYYHTAEHQDPALLRACFFVVFMIVYTMFAVKVGLDWFIFKDYYPLKERSPILSILLLLCGSMQIMMYPMLYSSNFFSASFTHSDSDVESLFKTKDFYRAISSSFWGTTYFIFFLRAMRIVYAHETHSSRNKSIAFILFKKEILLASITVGWILVRFFIIFFKSNKFPLIIERVTQDKNKNEELLFWVNIFWDFIWFMSLSYCLWLHKNVNQRYSIKIELIAVLSTQLIIVLFIIIITITSLNSEDKQILPYTCDSFQEFPLIQLVKNITLFFLMFVSVVWPLWKKKVYHMLLPTGRHYGFVKTMRDFLLQTEFRKVFTKFLEFMDSKTETTERSTLLKFWRQLITLKLNRTDSQLSKISSIKSLIEEVEVVLFRNEQNIILNLKESIVSLEESINNSDVIKVRYRQSINEKVDELEKIALERLDKIYVNEYRKTESYQYLKEIIKQNKRVNLNMILLNLALIVDSENQFV